MLKKAYAVIIGIADYHFINRLPRAVSNDAKNIYDLLIDPLHAGYLQQHVHVLSDREATREGILRVFWDLTTHHDKETTIFLYFSGHGTRIEVGNRVDEYLLPVDTRAETEQSLAETAISGSELTRIFAAIPARKVFAVFDCCHAEGVAHLKSATSYAHFSSLPSSYYERLQAGRGRVIMASSRSTEYSYIMPDARNSLFTWHLLDGLRGGAASEDGYIRVTDLFEYVQPRVTQDNPQQHPIFKSHLEENFPIMYSLDVLRTTAPNHDAGFLYDAYVSYVDQEPDRTWVWNTLVPYLTRKKIRIAVSGDVEEPGVSRIVSIERSIKKARRVIAVLSPAYLRDGMAEFQNVLVQTLGIQEGTYRLLLLQIAPLEMRQLPTRLDMLVRLDLTNQSYARHQLERLVNTLKAPLS